MRRNSQIQRRSLLSAIGLAPVAMAASRVSAATAFPDRPITLVVSYPPGGPFDRHARLLADLASVELGQRVVVENRPGAGGTLGMSTVVRNAKPDGYTIGLCSLAMMRVPLLQKAAWDPVRDFSWIASLAATRGDSFGFVVSADSPYRTMREFLDAARRQPGKLSYGTVGVGSSNHILVESLARAADVRLLHIPFKGSADLLPAAVGGHVDAAADLGGWEPLVSRGDLRLLLHFGDQPTGRWPGATTPRALGIDLVGSSFVALIGPRGTDPEAIAILQRVFRKLAPHPRHLALLEQLQQDPDYRDGAGMQDWAVQQYERERALLRRLGLAAD